MKSPIIAQMSGVGRQFDSVSALRNVSLTLYKGVSYAVIGPSGSGKSTLLNILGLLDQPTSGEYALMGHSMASETDRYRSALRRDVCGFVFQDFHLLPIRSVVENVMLGGYYAGMTVRARRRRAEQLIDQVGLGYVAGTSVANLSGGERQRVAIARALMNQPSLLLCDEPTGNLDTANASRVMNLLLSLGASITVVVVTHNPQVAAQCRQTIEVLDGTVTPSPTGAVGQEP